MGADSSSVRKDANDLGQAPENLLCIVPSKEQVLLVTKTSDLEIRNSQETIATRKLSLEPTCACATPTGTFVIGFKNGTITEFDVDLNLVNTYCLPGSCHGHKGEIISLAASPTREPYLFSIGADKCWNVWNINKGLLMSSNPFTGNLVATCASHLYAWTADTHLRVHVLSLDTMKLKHFPGPGLISTMMPIANGTGFIAAMQDGSVDIFSTYDVIAQFPAASMQNKMAAVLGIREDDGMVTFVAGDCDGHMTLRALEHVVGDVNRVIGLFTATENELIGVENDRIVKIEKKPLIVRALKNLPEDMELPRKSIVRFLQGEFDDAEGDEDDDEEEEY